VWESASHEADAGQLEDAAAVWLPKSTLYLPGVAVRHLRACHASRVSRPVEDRSLGLANLEQHDDAVGKFGYFGRQTGVEIGTPDDWTQAHDVAAEQPERFRDL
jgi:hypothetical protein